LQLDVEDSCEEDFGIHLSGSVRWIFAYM